MNIELRDLIGTQEVVSNSQMVAWKKEHGSFQAALDKDLMIETTSCLWFLEDFEDALPRYFEALEVIGLVEDLFDLRGAVFGMRIRVGERQFFVDTNVITNYIGDSDSGDVKGLANFALNLLVNPDLMKFHFGEDELVNARFYVTEFKVQ
ncbi:hypothetical protein F7U66_10900 [Vibrio parahaemolyticus]|nr:hypothetical protein [Vibrio parahaemolyticus]